MIIANTRETNKQQNKTHGIFYTEDIDVIDKILCASNFDCYDILNKNILEPSCGNGLIIIRLLKKLFDNKISLFQIKDFIENNLFFNDISLKAVNDTKSNIKHFLKNYYNYSEEILFNAFNFDFTEKQNINDLFSENNDFSKFYNYFDIILGNPPYVALYGRRDKKKEESKRNYFLNNYNQFPKNLKNGKINYVMLFIEHSIELLKYNGTLSFIIDISFFESAFQYLRKYILENTEIQRIIIDIKSFNVVSGQIIIKLCKREITDFNYDTIIENYQTKECFSYNIKSWYNENNEYKFEVINSAQKEILNKIKSINNNNFESLFPNKSLRTCCMLLDMEDKFTLPFYDKYKYKYKYFEGSKSLKNQYSKMEEFKYFYFNKNLQDKINNELKLQLQSEGIKNKKRIGLGETIIYDNPKLFIRQSAKKIIATYDDSVSAANNSLYVFSLREKSTDSIFKLKVILAQLNSSLLTFYAQCKRIIRYSKGKQPQIKIADLNQIPLFLNTEIDETLVSLVNSILSGENINESIYKIDTLIFDYYNITHSERSFINMSIDNFLKS